MRKPALLLIVVALQAAAAQQKPFSRLNSEVLDVTPPPARVSGVPGRMTVQRNPCRTLPTADTRRRIVDVAVQEWAFFGFSIVEPDVEEDDIAFEPFSSPRDFTLRTREAERVASTIAGYWAVTAEGPGIVASQNRSWNGPDGAAARWVAPWSAAFISWVMCEAGLGNSSQFQRSIAHHVYIDQAIRARDGNASQAAFAAYDAAEAAIEPGDMLCTSRRPVYRNLSERRRQMGEGARTHCDVVVKVDEDAGQILTIGGNVRRSVTLKVHPAGRERGKYLHPLEQPMMGRVRKVFAHLKLRAKPIEANAFDNSPAIKAYGCVAALPDAGLLASLSTGFRRSC